MLPDVGLVEILVIAVAVVLLTRPEDVPVVMHRLGVTAAYVRQFLGGMWQGWKEKAGL